MPGSAGRTYAPTGAFAFGSNLRVTDHSTNPNTYGSTKAITPFIGSTSCEVSEPGRVAKGYSPRRRGGQQSFECLAVRRRGGRPLRYHGARDSSAPSSWDPTAGIARADSSVATPGVSVSSPASGSSVSSSGPAGGLPAGRLRRNPMRPVELLQGCSSGSFSQGSSLRVRRSREARAAFGVRFSRGDRDDGPG
jgi:hypothetical protein